MTEDIKKVPVTSITYHAEVANREELETSEELPQLDDSLVTWINVDGVRHTERLQEFRQHFGLHSMVLDDLVGQDQRPKLEEFEKYLFIVLHQIMWVDGELESEQLSLVLGPNFLLSFQDTPGDIFDHIRKRIHEGSGRVRKKRADYLCYLLIDAVIQQHVRLVELMEEEAEQLEKEMLETEHASQLREGDTLKKIYHLRNKLSKFRQLTRPLREMMSGIIEIESDWVEDKTLVFFRDTYDQVRYLSDMVDNLREMLQGLIDLHMSQVNNRMSEVMKVLAMISTIFMPLNLIAAIYGMNFKFMPELEVKGFYFGVLGGMFVIAGFMFTYFKRKRWF